MRYLLYTLSAFCCLATIVLRLAGRPGWQAIVSVLLAAIFLVLAVAWDRATGRIGHRREGGTQLDVKDLSAQQKGALRDLLAQGKFGTAVRQVQLWFRNTDYPTAERVVKQLA